MIRQLLYIFILCGFFLNGKAQSVWPSSEEEMRKEAMPLEALPEVTPCYGICVVKGHLVNGYQLPDSISLRYFMGKENTIATGVDEKGDFRFHVPLARSCGAHLDNRCYLFLQPGDTTEVWLSQKSPLERTERKVFVRGPLASLVSDINNSRSQKDIIREHLSLENSDLLEYMIMEKTITDMLKTVANFDDTLPPLIMDEVLLVCKNPKVVYSRYFHDVLRVVSRYGIVTPKRLSQELRFYNVLSAFSRGEEFDNDAFSSLPEAYQQYFENMNPTKRAATQCE